MDNVSRETKKRYPLYTYNNELKRYFIDFDKVFSRNANMYFIFGEKSLGKTYGMTGYLYYHFLKTGRNFVFLRRRKAEWKTTRLNIFNDYFKKNKIGKEVKYTQYMIYIRDKKPAKVDEKDWKQKHPWEFFGGTYPLEDYGEVQGLAFSNVDTIFLDEFMIYNKQKRWIPNEADALQNIAQTVFRDNVKKFNCKVVACSNAGGMTNPYFTSYKVQPNDFTQTNFVWRDKVLFINCPATHNDNEFIKTTSTNSYKDFAVNNNFLDDTNILILPKLPKFSVPLYNIYVNDNDYFTLYKSPTDILFFGLVKKTNCDSYASNKTIQTPQALYNYKVIKYLKQAFDNRLLFFANSYIKNVTLEALGF